MIRINLEINIHDGWGKSMHENKQPMEGVHKWGTNFVAWICSTLIPSINNKIGGMAILCPLPEDIRVLYLRDIPKLSPKQFWAAWLYNNIEPRPDPLYKYKRAGIWTTKRAGEKVITRMIPLKKENIEDVGTSVDRSNQWPKELIEWFQGKVVNTVNAKISNVTEIYVDYTLKISDSEGWVIDMKDNMTVFTKWPSALLNCINNELIPALNIKISRGDGEKANRKTNFIDPMIAKIKEIEYVPRYKEGDIQGVIDAELPIDLDDLIRAIERRMAQVNGGRDWAQLNRDLLKLREEIEAAAKKNATKKEVKDRLQNIRDLLEPMDKKMKGYYMVLVRTLYLFLD